MIRNYTEEELHLQFNTSRKDWNKYKAERESHRLEIRRRVAVAILVEESRLATNGR
jgi:hypothetical protein